MLVILTVFFILLGIFAGFWCLQLIEHSSKKKVTFSLPGDTSLLTDGYFIIENEGLLTPDKPVRITEVFINSGYYSGPGSWENTTIYGKYRVEWIRFSLSSENGTGMFGLIIPEEEWWPTASIENADKSPNVNPAYNDTIEFYYSGVYHFEIDIGLNVTVEDETIGQTYYVSKWINTESSDVFVNDYNLEINYRNSKIQVFAFVFGAIVISLPIMIKSIMEIIEMRVKWSQNEKCPKQAEDNQRRKGV